MKEFDVFISHASEDKYIARLLRGYLRAHNIHSWLDQEQFNPSMARDDETLREKIIPAIRDSRYFILLLSEHSRDKKWVREECEAALKLREEGVELSLVAILLDDEAKASRPVWAEGIAYVDLRQEAGELDPLEKLRDEIGEAKPTYIAKVKPNFMKQIRQSEIDENLEKCMGDTLSMYLLDGGHSLQSVIFPAIETVMRDEARTRLKCRLLLMNSKQLQPSGLLSFDGAFQKRLDAMINDSDIRARNGEQAQLVREAAEMFAKEAARFNGLEYEIRLTDRLPIGRYFFTGEIGIYAPNVGRPTNASPVFIFNDKSPFYEAARRNYEETYDAAEVLASSDGA